MKRVLILLLLGLVACAPQDDNPLIAASDDQFLQAMDFRSSDCYEALFAPERLRNASGRPVTSDAAAVTKRACTERVQHAAARAGISPAVTPENLDDDRVLKRYAKLKGLQ
jgi:hypothetical protein